MANYHGPVCRYCRREGAKLYLKGERCYTPKCAIERRAVPPGAHGQRARKVSGYGVQLRAKQKARRTYGLLEKQFRNYYDEAVRQEGVTGLNLLRHLELRLDNVVYRLGLGSSRRQARQLVTHRHFEVNGRHREHPVVPGQARGRDQGPASERRDRGRSLEASRVRTAPSWLAFNEEEKSGKVLSLPDRQEMEGGVEEHLIVEFYSR